MNYGDIFTFFFSLPAAYPHVAAFPVFGNPLQKCFAAHRTHKCRHRRHRIASRAMRSIYARRQPSKHGKTCAVTAIPSLTLATGHHVFVIPGRSRSEATSRRPWDPYVDGAPPETVVLGCFRSLASICPAFECGPCGRWPRWGSRRPFSHASGFRWPMDPSEFRAPQIDRSRPSSGCGEVRSVADGLAWPFEQKILFKKLQDYSNKPGLYDKVSFEFSRSYSFASEFDRNGHKITLPDFLQ